MFVTAGVTAQAEKTMAEHAALEKVLELALDEARQAAVGGADEIEKSGQMLAHDPMQQGLLGIAAGGLGFRARVDVRHGVG